MKKQTNDNDGQGNFVRRYLGRRRVSPLSRRRGVETMMEEAGFFFHVLALVHSYCFFLHISDKRRAFRTVLCEKISKKKKKKIISYDYSYVSLIISLSRSIRKQLYKTY